MDTLGREIAVLLPIGLKVFYVPPDCPIFLRGERIKLRIVQAQDAVRITFEKSRGVFVVKLLEIGPLLVAPALGDELASIAQSFARRGRKLAEDATEGIADTPPKNS
ncbi:hypothetical protein ETAA8_18330 [Anatilimnocola aggregata]|uniref:Uncharacterized protein n=1 Tax=Anatilimnocola aggregata TaxID=2528021 RepID=A0A517Y9B5_9BACT|nr:hypothetical protein ETAA8_18330 [Anatilimnocola aggregata]